jgi:hypothetical protein
MTEELTPIEEPTSPSDPQPASAISSMAQAMNHVIEAAIAVGESHVNFPVPQAMNLPPSVFPPEHPIARCRDLISMQRQLDRDIQALRESIAIDTFALTVSVSFEEAAEAPPIPRSAAFTIEQVVGGFQDAHIALWSRSQVTQLEDTGDRVQRFEMPYIVEGIEIDTERLREACHERNRQTFRAMSLQILQNRHEQEMRGAPVTEQCRGCQDFHGRSYGNEFLVCGMHPYGYESGPCPDLRK